MDDNQRKTVALALLAVQSPNPMPPELAMGLLALDKQHQQYLKVALGQMLAKNPQALPEPNVAMQSVQRVMATRMADGRTLQETVATLPEARRRRLFEKAVKARLIPAPESRVDSVAAMPLNEQQMAQRSLTSLSAEQKSGQAASLRTDLALAGPKL
jgi:hypothetical protein